MDDRWGDFSKYADWDHWLWKEHANPPSGHGGMDYMLVFRLMQCMRLSLVPDFDVYDAALWTVPVPLSHASIKANGKPQQIPDFTRGEWKKSRLEFREAVGLMASGPGPRGPGLPPDALDRRNRRHEPTVVRKHHRKPVGPKEAVMEEQFVWVTTRRIAPGMLEEFERAWRPDSHPPGMSRAFAYWSQDSVEVVGVSFWESREACDAWRASEAEKRRRAVMAPYIAEEREAFYIGRELTLPGR